MMGRQTLTLLAMSMAVLWGYLFWYRLFLYIVFWVSFLWLHPEPRFDQSYRSWPFWHLAPNPPKPNTPTQHKHQWLESTSIQPTICAVLNSAKEALFELQETIELRGAIRFHALHIWPLDLAIHEKRLHVHKIFTWLFLLNRLRHGSGRAKAHDQCDKTDTFLHRMTPLRWFHHHRHPNHHKGSIR